eukprot:1394987-Rhodomonas_salina.1
MWGKRRRWGQTRACACVPGQLRPVDEPRLCASRVCVRLFTPETSVQVRWRREARHGARSATRASTCQPSSSALPRAVASPLAR